MPNVQIGGQNITLPYTPEELLQKIEQDGGTIEEFVEMLQAGHIQGDPESMDQVMQLVAAAMQMQGGGGMPMGPSSSGMPDPTFSADPMAMATVPQQQLGMDNLIQERMRNVQ